MMLYSPILVIQNLVYQVQCCYFYNLHSSGNGGAISVVGSQAGLNCEKSVFSQCTASGSFGAICFSEIVSEGIVRKSSFSLCDSSNDYAVGIIHCSKPIGEQISLEFCGYSCKNIVFELSSGSQQLSFSNSTDTYAEYHSGFHFSIPDDIEKAKYIHIANHRNCQFNFGFQGPDSNGNSSYINMINNTASSALIYLVDTTNHRLINYIFKKNTGTITAKDSRWPGTCTLINCSFFENKFDNGDYVITRINVKFSTNPPSFLCYLHTELLCSTITHHCPTCITITRSSMVPVLCILSLFAL